MGKIFKYVVLERLRKRMIKIKYLVDLAKVTLPPDESIIFEKILFDVNE